jgi:hypothetical protein
MDLVGIRKQFRDISGRYDLVNTDLSDNGANFFINEGSKWLDRKVETSKSWGSYPILKVAGSWYIQVPYARAFKEVWMTTTEGRVQLKKKRLQDLFTDYFTDLPASWVNGTPEFWSPALTRLIPEIKTPAEIASLDDYIGVITPISHEYNTVMLNVPVDQSTMFEIVGLFYSRFFTADTDENFWSQVHPLMLIQASILQVHTVSGNRVMMKNFVENLTDQLRDLGMDLVEQDIAEVDQMDG